MSGTVAYQGAPGAFGEEACRAFLPGWKPLACDSFEGVAEAVAARRAERGILPLRNSSAGAVPGNAELIAAHGLEIIAEHPLAVRMQLLGLPGASLAGLRTVVSHPIALAQCRRFLAEHRLALEEGSNTAVAARLLARSGDRARAVLASAGAAAAYGLAVLAADVHDDPANHTMFGIIARRRGAQG